MDWLFGQQKIAIIPEGFITKCQNFDKVQILSEKEFLYSYEKDRLYIKCRVEEAKQLGLFK